LHGARTRHFRGDAEIQEVPDAPPNFVLPESLEDFRAVSVEPEELSYGMLRRQIKDLRRKGVDTSESWVDLHLKLALPAASLVMMLLAVPLATVGTRLSSFAASAGLGLALGFGYFVLLAFARALGQSGALPPPIAAWAANATCALIAGYFLLGSD
jgi:lipopolysaccharide export system permease protein